MAGPLGGLHLPLMPGWLAFFRDRERRHNHAPPTKKPPTGEIEGLKKKKLARPPDTSKNRTRQEF